MDGRTFDDLVRSFASRSSRRRLLRRGIGVAAAASGLATLDPASAARRGYSGKVTICTPVAGGGYVSMTVPTAQLPSYLAAGAVLDKGCCAGSDCGGGDGCSTAVCTVATGACGLVFEPDGTDCTPDGPINQCRLPYTCQGGVCSEGTGSVCAEVAGGCIRLIGCNPSTGQCDYGPVADGTSCGRGSGCVPGTCAAGVCLDPPVKTCPSTPCEPCGYDACQDTCTCLSVGCAGDAWCADNYCDNVQGGCVSEPINEGAICGVTGDGSQRCVSGVCTTVQPV